MRRYESVMKRNTHNQDNFAKRGMVQLIVSVILFVLIYGFCSLNTDSSVAARNFISDNLRNSTDIKTIVTESRNFAKECFKNYGIIENKLNNLKDGEW